MKILDNILQRVQDVNEGLEGGRFFSDIIQDAEAEIVEMNTEDQLFSKGIDSEGIEIMRYAPYSELTKEIKEQKGQPYDRVTLRDTGDFHYSFEVEADSDKMVIIATDEKTEDLLDRYGEEIIGLTDENLQKFRDETLLPKLMETIKQTLSA